MIDSTKKLINWGIVLFFVFLFGFLPPFGAMTQEGMRILGVFIGAVYGWSTIGILEVAIVAIVGYGLVVGFPTFVSSSFGNPMIAMMMMFFPVCGMLNKYGVLGVLAKKFVTTKFCEGHPWRICFMIMFTTFICAPINGPVIAILMMTFVGNICKVANIKTPSPLSVALAIGVALGCMCGQMIIPIFGAPLVLLAALSAMTGITVNYATFMLLIIPSGLVVLLTFILCMRYILRIDASALGNLTADNMGGKVKFSKDQFKALIATGLLLFAMILNSIIPYGTDLYNFYCGKLGTFGIPIVGITILMFLKNEEGKQFFNFSELAREGFAWEPFLMAAFIVPFSSYMTGGTTGIAQTITSLMGPLMNLPPMAFVLLALAFVCIVTNFANNTVVCIMCLPFFMAYGAATGMDMEGWYILMFLVAQIAILTPGASTMCGIVYSYRDLVDVSVVTKQAVKVLPFLFVILMVVSVPLLLLLF